MPLAGVDIVKHEATGQYRLRHEATGLLVAPTYVTSGRCNSFTRLRDAREAVDRLASLGLDWTPERPDFIDTPDMRAKVISLLVER